MTHAPARPIFWNRLDIHDRKQFEIKLEYQPSGEEPRSRYLVETFLFLPASLNVDGDTYPRSDFYADIHNYVRLKTPMLPFEEMLASDQSPLVKLERRLEIAIPCNEAEIIYDAKMLSCVFRAALRRLVRSVNEHCAQALRDAARLLEAQSLETELRHCVFSAEKVLARFRGFSERVTQTLRLEERTRASLRLVDEYMSLTVEQFFRKATTDMDRLPRHGVYNELRRELMGAVIREESYRRDHQLRSVLSPTGDNEEYMHRIGFLKKFCMNILFLAARREEAHKGTEEVLFAIAAGVAMAFASAVAFWAQSRFPQVSLNFFLIVVVGYMMKDRIKEGLRRIFRAFASRHLFERSTVISDPVTKRKVGLCQEKVDYGSSVMVPPEIAELRRVDDFITVSQGELSETVIRYQKQILLNAELLPRVFGSVSGVTDIIRINIDRLLRDMDDPEYAIEYVDLEDLTVGKVRGAKSYQIDMAFRFTVGEKEARKTSLQLVRLVLDRNGIKRMLRYGGDPEAAEGPAPVRSVA